MREVGRGHQGGTAPCPCERHWLGLGGSVKEIWYGGHLGLGQGCAGVINVWSRGSIG